MIIGNLISDIEIIDKTSRRRLTPTKSESNRPLNPVRILGGHVECRPGSDSDQTTE